ncbi:VCBS domain-containing protein [Methylobacterium sp. J-078]|uniref:VCBS domain-containing protein n=1 Tax=Methylobacterium sp. J-078 TaxID=2836657 RepID=UPI001FB9B9D1|nr:VCBS domain-containing protein [Methylobacterium sp. J-078]MCJ2044702.1 VCBS domain-containing protein [Methylobacterium sp. J-078]
MATYNGSNADDKYFGAIGDDYYNVGEGNNTVIDLGGRNVVNAGSGNDTITTGDGDDQINAGDGLNVIAAGGGNNNINAGSGADRITAGSGNDQINAGEGDNTVDAGDGNNTVNAASGNDAITTGSGDDQINAGNGNNTIRAGGGRNMVNAGSGDDFIVTGSGDDQINAGDGKNTIDAGDGRNVINTGSGADTITTGSGDDQINAGEGNNLINAGGGNNRVTAGSGNDTITAGAGNNEIYAGEGNNTVTLGAGNSRVYTGSGADVITLGTGNNEVYAGEGNNTVTVAGGNSRIYTGSGADTITTGAGNDTIFAGGGNDRVILGGGSDLVYLGDGNDVARLTLAQSKGGAHIDLWGEGGSDTLQLVLNTAEAQDAAVLADIQGFQKHLAGDGNWMYQFKTADITVRQFEKLEIVAPVLAAADKATTAEDGPVTIQVLANDKDLLAASNAALHVTELVTTGLQGTATISADGKSVVYDPGQAFQYLKAGEQADVTFQYKVADDQGFVDTASVTVTVTGVNDVATIAGTAAGTVVEDGVLKASGTLTVSDLDAGQSHFAAVAASVLHGTYGDFSFNDGAWDYTLRNGDANVQALAEGQLVSDTLAVKSLDGTASSTISVSITGTNDAATFTGDDTKTLTETNAILTTNGVLVAHDIDSPATFKAQANVAGSAGYGHFSIGADGAWTYVTDTPHDEFAAGQTYTDTLLVQSADGTGHTLTVNILGTADFTTSTELVGAWRVGEGPYWGNAPKVYSGQEAAAFLLGGTASDYAISTNKAAITHTAFYDQYAGPFTERAENLHTDTAPNGYSYPDYSSFVGDHGVVQGFLTTQYSIYTATQANPYTNYAFREVNLFTAAPDQSTVGTSGVDKIVASSGSTLTGGAGSDYFAFASTAVNHVTITDFSAADDTLIFDHAGFGGNLQPGGVATTQFTNGDFTNGDQRFAFHAADHTLWYDADGSNAGAAATLIATLQNVTALTHYDLVMV